MFGGEVQHGVFRNPFVKDEASPVELWAFPTPAGVCVVLTIDAVRFIFVTAVVGTVLITTSAAGVRFRFTGCSEVPPTSTFHALHGLLFLLSRPYHSAADYQPVSDEIVSVIR